MEHHGGGLFFGAGPSSSRRGSHAHSSQPTSEYGGYDDEADEQAMERSRVQLVSSRRKPSQEADDFELDLFRASFASNASSHSHMHHLYQQQQQPPYSNGSGGSAGHAVHNHYPLHASLKKSLVTSASASSYIEATTPDFKKPAGVKKKKTRSKDGSQPHGAFADDSADNSRRSLPALDSTHASGRKSTKYTRHEELGEHSSRRVHGGGGHDDYFQPGSPIMSSTMSSTKEPCFDGPVTQGGFLFYCTNVNVCLCMVFMLLQQRGRPSRAPSRAFRSRSSRRRC